MQGLSIVFKPYLISHLRP